MQVIELNVIETASSLAQEFKKKIPIQRHKTVTRLAGPIGNHSLRPPPSSFSPKLLEDGNSATLRVY